MSQQVRAYTDVLSNEPMQLRIGPEIVEKIRFALPDEMYDEENQYRDFVDIRFNKHFDYYFNIIWDLKEEPI